MEKPEEGKKPAATKSLRDRITSKKNETTTAPSGQPNNPLHGVKLADILERLVENYGWENLGKEININCFKNDPSIKSSLTFLRRTPWARDQVEQLYLEMVQGK